MRALFESGVKVSVLEAAAVTGCLLYVCVGETCQMKMNRDA